MEDKLIDLAKRIERANESEETHLAPCEYFKDRRKDGGCAECPAFNSPRLCFNAAFSDIANEIRKIAEGGKPIEYGDTIRHKDIGIDLIAISVTPDGSVIQAGADDMGGSGFLIVVDYARNFERA